MKTPVLQDDALLEDILSVPDESGDFHLWWLGQSGFLLKWHGKTLILDPYLSDSLTQKYAGTGKPHVRVTGRCIAPARLGFADVISSSHAHTDHLDAATLIPLAGAHDGPLPLVLPSSSVALARERLEGADFRFHPMDEGTVSEVSGFSFTGIPAAHDTLERDGEGRCRFLGYIVKFGPWTIYHSGDTRWFPELPDLLRPHRADVMLLPINGHDPARGVAGNLDGAEAAQLAADCGAGLVIPCHYDLFEFNTATPALFESTCRNLDQPYRILGCGGCFTSPRQIGFPDKTISGKISEGPREEAQN